MAEDTSGVPHNLVREDGSSIGFPSYPTNDLIVVAIPAPSQKK